MPEDDSAPRPPGPQWPLLAAALLVLAGCAAPAPAPAPAESRFLPDETTTQSPAELEDNAGVRLPAGSLVLSAARTALSGGLESRTFAQIRMPAGAVARFLTDSGLPALTPGRRTVTDEDVPGSGTWHPDKATDIAGTGDARRRVMTENTSPDATVYLVATQN